MMAQAARAAHLQVAVEEEVVATALRAEDERERVSKLFTDLKRTERKERKERSCAELAAYKAHQEAKRKAEEDAKRER